MASDFANPYVVSIDDDVLKDVQARLQNRRKFQRQACPPWQQGCREEELEDLLRFWREEYNWRAQEEFLNSFSHFRGALLRPDVDETLNIHFIHERSTHTEAQPLLLLHGWPGSVVEFLNLIPKLINNKAESFHVVIPSLPGYGFSDTPREEGLNAEVVADMMDDLMAKLGYDQYFVQGGDWGGIVGRAIGVRHPEHCKALHINFCTAVAPPLNSPRNLWTILRYFGTLILTPLLLSRNDADKLAATRAFAKAETAYQMIQATKPESLGVALSDSPAGLAAWFLEKFYTYASMPICLDCDGDVFATFDKTTLITNIMLYWINNNITGAMRLYYESLGVASGKSLKLAKDYCRVPTAVADFPKEIIRVPRAAAQLTFNIVQWHEFKAGGHFAALEQPDVSLLPLEQFTR
ncbi:uncharacterized protein MONBRDRAFT_15084 [Monosiga brevicollis MX1]|uniref:Epoxide hydrolase N-terminal domain-containing protein n=1 Tax=Monosiga brevicollis TaxID=81824 RepID=A9UTQ8_MONBE|nr:uncharacterized protein MONBRDRAFT_15084 [Monosiga brevicollis MX1]EDQ91532.1 predicted protein [Monosiga brevicollis MX1]|eukprot:XP_001743954.1 hypothetical protein [Monosiga brevicollis MX1]